MNQNMEIRIDAGNKVLWITIHCIIIQCKSRYNLIDISFGGYIVWLLHRSISNYNSIERGVITTCSVNQYIHDPYLKNEFLDWFLSFSSLNLNPHDIVIL